MVKICSEPYPAESELVYADHFAIFPYPLSDFQKYAIEAIVEGHHVLTAAPTGSGKTLSAEFALQYFAERGKRVFYTTPIKALSNQKYYEFTNRYPHIRFGLLTGDIKTNPDADVVIMTAEILTNQLFLGETLESVGAVVMDEVHYINDEHRGQTWEQTILMMPEHIQMIMLSATLDEPRSFAEWVESRGFSEAKTPEKRVYLATTHHRIVPLTHYSYIASTESFLKNIKDKAVQQEIRAATNRLIPIQTAKNVFVESGVKEVRHVLSYMENRELFLKRKFVLNHLAGFLKQSDMLPAICFVFSRKSVEKCAQEMTLSLFEDDSKVPYIVRRECEQIVRRLPNYQEYLALPEYNTLVSLLESGIGIHHSGMIPILREIVELMISKKYIKLLFATESFSIGLDCPIRTAIFTSLTKFDGKHERYLLPHEYTQSAGRAGRRGIDTVGHVVHCANLFPLPTMAEYKDIMCGKPQKLVSKFHIHYSMVLGLLKKGQTGDFHTFAEKSMIRNELVKKTAGQTALLENLAKTIVAKRAQLALLRTPVETCRTYMDLSERLKTAVNKKRRDLEKDVRTIKDQYRYVEEDSRSVSELSRLESEQRRETEYLGHLDSFIVGQTDLVCRVLAEEGFVNLHSRELPETPETPNSDSWGLTHLGKIAAGIAEIHPLIIAKCMMDWNQLARFSEFQLIAFLSCFTDVKVPEDHRIVEPRSNDPFLESKLVELRAQYHRYEQIELTREIYTGISYDDALMFDLVDDMAEWCRCETEEQCKYFIQTRLAEKGISVGDFTKACMKISTISKELSGVCLPLGFVELVYKLENVDKHILKYIATTQSLYV